MITYTNITLYIILGFLVGLLIGFAAWYRSKLASQREKEELRVSLAALEKEREADIEKLKWTEQVETKMREAFTALASEALQTNAEALTQQTKGNLKSLVDPLFNCIMGYPPYIFTIHYTSSTGCRGNCVLSQ